MTATKDGVVYVLDGRLNSTLTDAALQIKTKEGRRAFVLENGIEKTSSQQIANDKAYDAYRLLQKKL